MSTPSTSQQSAGCRASDRSAHWQEQACKTITNGHTGPSLLSLCIPTWNDDAHALLTTLSCLDGARQCALIVYDDGTAEAELTQRLTRLINAYPGPARLISADKNHGRSWARNQLMNAAGTDWLLFIDADMQPDEDTYLRTYLAAISQQESPGLIVGGISLKQVRQSAETRLHAEQSRLSECIPAERRRRAPGRYVFSSNLVVHRDILETIPFDTSFRGWGWEDVDWGLRIESEYPVIHIDNTATHLGLDSDTVLLEKYSQSGPNFARTLNKSPDGLRTSTLYRMARLMRYVPVRKKLGLIWKSVASARFLPIRLRVLGLKLYRASIYAAYV